MQPRAFCEQFHPAFSQAFFEEVAANELTAEVVITFPLPGSELTTLRAFRQDEAQWGAYVLGLKQIIDAIITWAKTAGCPLNPRGVERLYQLLTIKKPSELDDPHQIDLYRAGPVELAKIAKLLSLSTINLDTKKLVLVALFNTINVCSPGVYMAIADARLELEAALGIKYKLMRFRLSLAQQTILEMIKYRNSFRSPEAKIHPSQETHYTRALTNELAEQGFGIPYVQDSHIVNCKKSLIDELFAELKTLLSKSLTPRELLNFLLIDIEEEFNAFIGKCLSHSYHDYQALFAEFCNYLNRTVGKEDDNAYCLQFRDLVCLAEDDMHILQRGATDAEIMIHAKAPDWRIRLNMSLCNRLKNLAIFNLSAIQIETYYLNKEENALIKGQPSEQVAGAENVFLCHIFPETMELSYVEMLNPIDKANRFFDLIEWLFQQTIMNNGTQIPLFSSLAECIKIKDFSTRISQFFETKEYQAYQTLPDYLSILGRIRQARPYDNLYGWAYALPESTNPERQAQFTQAFIEHFYLVESGVELLGPNWLLEAAFIQAALQANGQTSEFDCPEQNGAFLIRLLIQLEKILKEQLNTKAVEFVTFILRSVSGDTLFELAFKILSTLISKPSVDEALDFIAQWKRIINQHPDVESNDFIVSVTSYLAKANHIDELYEHLFNAECFLWELAYFTIKPTQAGPDPLRAMITAISNLLGPAAEQKLVESYIFYTGDWQRVVSSERVHLYQADIANFIKFLGPFNTEKISEVVRVINNLPKDMIEKVLDPFFDCKNVRIPSNARLLLSILPSASPIIRANALLKIISADKAITPGQVRCIAKSLPNTEKKDFIFKLLRQEHGCSFLKMRLLRMPYWTEILIRLTSEEERALISKEVDQADIIQALSKIPVDDLHMLFVHGRCTKWALFEFIISLMPLASRYELLIRLLESKAGTQASLVLRSFSNAEMKDPAYPITQKKFASMLVAMPMIPSFLKLRVLPLQFWGAVLVTLSIQDKAALIRRGADVADIIQTLASADVELAYMMAHAEKLDLFQLLVSLMTVETREELIKLLFLEISDQLTMAALLVLKSFSNAKLATLWQYSQLMPLKDDEQSIINHVFMLITMAKWAAGDTHFVKGLNPGLKRIIANYVLRNFLNQTFNYQNVNPDEFRRFLLTDHEFRRIFSELIIKNNALNPKFDFNLMRVPAVLRREIIFSIDVKMLGQCVSTSTHYKRVMISLRDMLNSALLSEHLKDLFVFALKVYIGYRDARIPTDHQNGYSHVCSGLFGGLKAEAKLAAAKYLLDLMMQGLTSAQIIEQVKSSPHYKALSQGRLGDLMNLFKVKLADSPHPRPFI